MKNVWILIYGETQLVAGVDHSAALTSDGRLFLWGGGSEGQLGFGVDILETPTPRQLKVGNASIIDAACGYYHTAVVTSECVCV